MKTTVNRISVLMICTVVGFIGRAFSQTNQTANDHMFPAAAAAQATSTYDSKGFIINGKRTFLVSAGLEYARIPHQLWRDRLLRIKRDGYNCIEIYNFWNFHEPQDGVFDFSGDHDLNAFLKLVKGLNMYAIARVGPYYCAEWDMGGYPLWLRFKEGLSVREPNPVFEKYVDRFLDHIMPIIRDNQINRGGAVILVQLENEHPLGWGTITPNDYFKHLQTKALALGLEVPYFFSGLHHGSDPARNSLNFDDPSRPNPWITTEFWSVWFTAYGSGQKDADTYERRTWKIIAHGGNGYNVYMAHGGTNFDYTNDNEDAASYDYGAEIGQTGDLRQMYYQLKRNAYFARSFENILENSLDAGSSYNSIVTDPALHVNGRKSPYGDIIFIDNPDLTRSVIAKLNIDGDQLQSAESLTVSPGEILPIVHGFNLSKNIKMDWALTRVLGISRQGNTTTLVIHGAVASPAYLQFSVTGEIKIIKGNDAFSTNGGTIKLNIKFNEGIPNTYTFQSKNQIIRILAVDDHLSDRTWFVDANGKNYVITGPEYTGNTILANNHLQIETEHYWEQKIIYPTWVFGEGLIKTAIKSLDVTPTHEEALPFKGEWMAKTAFDPAKPEFDDSGWTKSKDVALQMGADGDRTAEAWYRTTVNVQQAGIYTLKSNGGGDRATVYVDGTRATTGNIHQTELQINLKTGKHLLAIFTAHDGRDKLVNYIGPIKDLDSKGLSGQVVLQKDKNTYLTDWKVRAATEDRTLPVGMDTSAVYKIGDNAFKTRLGYAWLQATIPYETNHTPTELKFGGLSDKATVFINGKEAGVQGNSGSPLIVPLAGLLKPGTPIIVNVYVQSTFRGRGITKPVEVIYYNPDNLYLTNWRLKGGPGDLNVGMGWRTLNPDKGFDGPVFFKNTFAIKSLQTKSKGMYRVSVDGLGHGSIWVNGHNLGRYPEKIQVKGLYIPECWLIAGTNTLMLYDEDGKTPEKINIQAEKLASRDIRIIKF